MPKKPNGKSKPGKSVPAQKTNKSIRYAMELFLAGCAAECYLLIVRRFYVDGTVNQMLAFHSVLLYLLFIGLGLALVGLALALVWRKAGEIRRTVAAAILIGGVFLAASSWIIRTFFPSGTFVLCIVVPAAVLLGVLWNLYERECFFALSVLGLTVLALWICRRGIGNEFWNTSVLIGAFLYVVFLLALVLLARRLDRTDGRLLGRQMLPAGTDYLVVYGTCGLSAVTMVLAVFSATLAYYAMWVIALAIFVLAVYYTVRQL